MDSNEQPNGAQLFAKMARIMGKIKRLPKSGHNKHFDYKFTTDSDVADTIREHLAEENIAFFAETVAVEPVMGKKSRAQYVFTFACGDTGYTRSCSWFAEADDGQDKGLNKAATAAEKFFLLKTFVMSTGDERDDPDSDAHLSKQQKPTNGTPDYEAEALNWFADKGVAIADVRVILGIEKQPLPAAVDKTGWSKIMRDYAAKMKKAG